MGQAAPPSSRPGHHQQIWPLVVAGIGLLILAQILSQWVMVPLRGNIVPAAEVFSAVKPGELAGTLMLGGFRGLATDLLWMQADQAEESGEFYKSLALSQAITRIQPRFHEVWEYQTYDMAYNITADIQDPEGKWGWYLSALQVGARGIERNPESVRLLLNLAWLFHDKGEYFTRRVAATDWDGLIQPVLDQVDRQLPREQRLAPLPRGAGTTNFALSCLLYQAAIALADAHQHPVAPFVRRMVAIAIERDGNLLRNQGRHRQAVLRWIDALQTWQQVLAWQKDAPADTDTVSLRVNRDSYEHNEGRLRRKAAFLAGMLAPDHARQVAVEGAITQRHFRQARTLLQGPGWRDSAYIGHVTWLDRRPGGPTIPVAPQPPTTLK